MLHEHPDQNKRYKALAEQYAQSPGNTRVVSPDNESRLELNAVIRAKLQDAGHVAKDSHQTSVLRVRQDLTLEDKFHAFSYEPGDVVRYAKNNPGLGFKAKEALIPALERVHEKSKALAPEEIQQYWAEHEFAITP